MIAEFDPPKRRRGRPLGQMDITTVTFRFDVNSRSFALRADFDEWLEQIVARADQVPWPDKKPDELPTKTKPLKGGSILNAM